MIDTEKNQKSLFLRPVELASSLLPVFFLLLALYFSTKVLIASSQIILLLLASILIAILVNRLAAILRKKVQLPQRAGVCLVLLAFLSIIAMVSYLVGSQMNEQFGQLIRDIPGSFEKLQDMVRGTPFGPHLENLTKETSTRGALSRLFGNLSGVFSSLAGLLSALFFFIAVTLYLSLYPETYLEGTLKLFKYEERKREARKVLMEMGEQLWQFLLGQMLAMLMIGIGTTLGLWLLGIPSYLALGLIAGLLAFVPVIGPALAYIPALLVAFSVSMETVLYITLLYGGIELIESNFLSPLIQENMTAVPPVLMLTSQAVMGILFGLFGVALAAPIAVIGLVLIKELYLKGESPSQPEDAPVAYETIPAESL